MRARPLMFATVTLQTVSAAIVAGNPTGSHTIVLSPIPVSTFDTIGVATALPPTVIVTVAAPKFAPGYESDQRAGMSGNGTKPRFGHATNCGAGAGLGSPMTQMQFALLKVLFVGTSPVPMLIARE